VAFIVDFSVFVNSLLIPVASVNCYEIRVAHLKSKRITTKQQKQKYIACVAAVFLASTKKYNFNGI
jgi:hypothetical protein